MARAFDGSTQDAINLNGVTGIDVHAFSMFCWFNLEANVGGARSFFEADADTGTTSDSRGQLRIDVNELFMFAHPFSSGGGVWKTSITASLDTWYSVAARYDRSSIANDPTMFVDGSKLTVGAGLTETNTPAGGIRTGTDTIVVGSGMVVSRRIPGRVAEVAFWTRELLDDEFLALAAGYSPRSIPNGLAFYAPLIGRTSPEKELMQGADLTLTGGPTYFEHPPVIGPRAVAAAPAPGAAVVVAADVALAFEILAGVAADGALPVAWAGAVAVQADARLPLEIRSALAADAPLSLAIDRAVVADAPIPAAFGVGVISDQSALAEWLTGLGVDQPLQAGHGVLVLSGEAQPVAWDGQEVSVFIDDAATVFGVSGRGTAFRAKARAAIFGAKARDAAFRVIGRTSKFDPDRDGQ